MKKVLIAIPLLLASGIAFSQTDYFFVLGGTANGNRTLPVFYTLLSSIISENDTVSVLSSSGAATLVCPPVAGDTPHIASILPSFPSAPSGDSASALALAGEQAAIYGRQGARRALVVISSDQNDAPLARPTSFTDIYYIAVDAPLNPALTAVSNPGCAWEINDDSLADVLSGFITLLAPRYKKVKKSALDDDAGVLSIGDFFHKTKRAALLVENGAAGQTAITKSRIPVSCDLTQIDGYSVVALNDPAWGKYDVGNGKALVAVEWNELSPIVFIAAGSILAFIIALLVIAASVAVARDKRLRKPAYKVGVCNKDGDLLGKSVWLGVKESRGKNQQFKSGDSVFQLCDAMKLADDTEGLKEMLKKDENDAVIAGQTFIKWDKKKDDWCLEYPDGSTDVIKKSGGAKKSEKLFEEEGMQVFFTKL
ncbi:MAG: hypothetical protein LBL45_10650 [Treponema sp.]|nr:hypothetical protein [Treponema sp.]